MEKKSIVLITILLWIFLVIVWGIFYVLENINNSSLVGYEKDWDFQLVFFIYDRLPLLFVSLLILLTGEYYFFKCKKIKKDN